MATGVIVYSLTGHTLSVAEQLRDRLAQAGHGVTLERVEVVGPADLKTEPVAELKTCPAPDPYDPLIICSAVRGGTLPPPMKRYMEQLPSLQGKRVALLVTHFFRTTWGAQQVLSQMRELAEARGATVLGVAEVRWPGLRRKQRIDAAVDTLLAHVAGS